MPPIWIEPEAEADLELAWSWYEDQRAGLGDELLVEVDELLAMIGQRPELFRASHRGLRQAMVHRFPYALYYRIRHETVAVVAVLVNHHPSSNLEQAAGVDLV